MPAQANDAERMLNAIIGTGINMMMNDAQRRETERARTPVEIQPVSPARRDEPAISRDRAFQLQARLNELGYDVGTPDGAIGNNTRRGIARYQASIGAAQTGYITSGQLSALLAGAPSVQQLAAGDPDMLAPQEMRALQQALKDKGYEVGDIDGVAGRATGRAVAAFLTDNGYDPYTTSIRATYELALDNDAGSPVATVQAAAMQGDAGVAASLSEQVFGSRFPLTISDGAVVVGDMENTRAEGEKLGSLDRLALQLVYQADPSALEADPILFMYVLDEAVLDQYLAKDLGDGEPGVYQADPHSSALGRYWRAGNEFEVADLRSRLVEELRSVLESSRVALPFDVLEMRYISLGSYDTAAQSFPLSLSDKAETLSFSNKGGLVAPLPFARFPDALAMQQDQARLFLERRGNERNGYIGTRMAAVAASVDGGRPQISLQFRSGGLHPLKLEGEVWTYDLGSKIADLPPYEGAFLAGASGDTPSSGSPHPLAPDGAFEVYVKTNPQAAIPEGVWDGMARSRFSYEHSLIDDPAAYQALGTKRFSYATLKANAQPEPEHIAAYKATMLADATPAIDRFSCRATIEPRGDAYAFGLSEACGLTPWHNPDSSLIRDVEELLEQNGMHLFRIVANQNEVAASFAFADDPRFYEGSEFTVPRADVAGDAATLEASFEFAVEDVVSDLAGDGYYKTNFILLARPVNVIVGGKVFPFDTGQAPDIDVAEWHDVLGIRLGMAKDAAMSALAEHQTSLSPAETFHLDDQTAQQIYGYVQDREWQGRVRQPVDISQLYPLDEHGRAVTVTTEHLERVFTAGTVLESEFDAGAAARASQPQCDGCSYGQNPNDLILRDQSVVYFDPAGGQVVGISRYQSFERPAGAANLQASLRQRYGEPDFQDGRTMIWVADELAARKLTEESDLFDLCGASLADPDTDPLFQPWKSDAEEARSRIRDLYGFHISETDASCGPLLAASITNDRYWLVLLDTDWVRQRKADVAAADARRETEQTKSQAGAVKF